MGDSDDDYDRKRRDKFKGERTESYRDGRRDDRRGRDDWERDWSNGRSGNKRDYREFRGGARDRYSPHHSQDIMPPSKKFRGDWEDKMRYGFDFYGPGKGNWNHQESYYGGRFGGGFTDHIPVKEPASSASNLYIETQPPMMTFKAFLATQEDSITDEEAIKRYNAYKLEFKKGQLNDFFVAHKDEEWFKTKYHPEESAKRKEEQLEAIKKRIKVFLGLLESSEIDEVTLDVEQSDKILTLLDGVVIQLEGGTEEDLRIFKQNESMQIKTEKPDSPEKPKRKLSKDQEEEKPSSPKRKLSKDKEEKNEEEEENPEEKKEEKTNDKEEDEEDEEDEEEEEEKEKEKEKEAKTPTEVNDKHKENEENEQNDDSAKEDEKPKEDNEEEDKAAEEENHASEKEEGEEEEEKEKDEEPPKPKLPLTASTIQESINRRFLHKTSSIFLRNLAPTVTKAEVEAICKKFPGFLRVAIADPQPERRWFRRGWVSFERNVNIKEICWNLNNIRLRDCELGAIVNRDLSKRIRAVGGLTCHKQIVKNDIKLSAKIAFNLDNRLGLWKKSAEDLQNNDSSTVGFISDNPVLKNITDYLIEEASAEEEELLGITGQDEAQTGDSDDVIERDQTLISVLDRIIYYLRIVHSVDYYNHCEYPNEDEMPNRCGIMHVRGSPPTSKVTNVEVQDYCRNFESKISSFLTLQNPEEEAEYTKLGAKNSDLEVEKFIQANTQELSTEKWLCPLSNKKFKGPEFVRKHIFNKHAEKVAEVRSEAEYFNNYLKDSKRPQLPDHPGSRTPAKDTQAKEVNPVSKMPPVNPFIFMSNMGNMGRGPYGMGMGPGFGMPPRQPRGFSRGRGGSSDFRPVIHYRDLDAPREPDEFL